MPNPSQTRTASSTLKRATARREASEQAWKDAIHAAHTEGMSVRAIADIAGISHQRVHQILHGR